MKKTTQLLLNIGILVVLFYAVTGFQERNLLKSDDTPAPYFNLAKLNPSSERLSIAKLQGQKTVVYFFAPWCSICRYSMPNLEEAYKADKVNAIAIALGYKSKHAVMRFATDLNLSMPVLLGTTGTQNSYKISAYPTYYIIDEQLHIVGRAMGYSTELGIMLRTSS